MRRHKYEDEQRCYDELTAWTLAVGDAEFLHQHVVDCWAAQNAAHESKAMTIAFALLGLYLYVEKDWTGRRVQTAHMRLAQPHGRGAGRKEWPRFDRPARHAEMTACDVMHSPESARREAVREWCRSEWEAWNAIHEQIREWVDAELARL